VRFFGGKNYTFEAEFERTSPASFTEKVGIPLGWIVVHYGHIPDKVDRRKAHGEWFELKSERGTVYRMLRFSPQVVKGGQGRTAKIVIDWIGWIDLHNREEDVSGSINLRLRRVSWWKRPVVYLRHPDPAVRLSGWLGWLSVLLGTVSLVMTIDWSWLAALTNAIHNFVSARITAT
jgi:hypothetical protein